MISGWAAETSGLSSLECDMGRPPTPIAILERRGSIRKNPQRYREKIAAQPKSSGPLGPPPGHWDVSESCYYRERHARWCRIWAELDQQISKGVLKSSDRILVELLCQAIDKQRTRPGEMKPAEQTHLLAMLAKIGLTPVDRMRVASDDRERSGRKESDWEKLA